MLTTPFSAVVKNEWSSASPLFMCDFMAWTGIPLPLVIFGVITYKALCFVKWEISDSKMKGCVLCGRGSVLGWSTDFPIPTR